MNEENHPQHLHGWDAFYSNNGTGSFFSIKSCIVNLGNYSLQQRNLIIFVMLLILGLTIFVGLRAIAQGLLGAIIIYVIFRPMNIYLQEKKHWNRSLATLLILLTALVCLVIPFFMLIRLVADKITYYSAHPEDIESILRNVNDYAERKLNIPHVMDDTIAKVKEGAAQIITGAVNKRYSFSFNWL